MCINEKSIKLCKNIHLNISMCEYLTSHSSQASACEDCWEAYNYAKTFTVWPIIIAYSLRNWGTKTSHVNRCLFFIFLSLSPPDMKHRIITIVFSLLQAIVFQARNQISVKTRCRYMLWVYYFSLVFEKYLHVRAQKQHWCCFGVYDGDVWPAICPLFSRYIKISPLYLPKDVKHGK